MTRTCAIGRWVSCSSSFSEQTTRLVHQELELAKAEITQKGKQAGMGAGMFGGAGALGLAALGCPDRLLHPRP